MAGVWKGTQEQGRLSGGAGRSRNSQADTVTSHGSVVRVTMRGSKGLARPSACRNGRPLLQRREESES